MDQGQIICSFCSAQFTVPPGLNEAICPKCGKAMPLFKTRIGVGEAEGIPPAAEEEEIWDTVEDFQEPLVPPAPPTPPDDNEVVGRIALKQVPANQLRQPKKTMMGQGAPGLSSLATTDDEGRLIPDVIHGGEGSQAAPGPSNGGQSDEARRSLDFGFDLGPEVSSLDDDGSVRPLAGLGAQGEAPAPSPSGMPNLLDELDAEMDNSLPGEEEIPEAEPLMEMGDEVADFFESEQTPGMVLPDDGAIVVSIPEAPIQERMRSENISVSTGHMEAVGDGLNMGAEEKSAMDANVASDLTPVLRLAIFIGLGMGVMLLIGLLYWLIQ